MNENREVTLADMLSAREERAARIAAALREGHTPLISFSMNIPGAVKRSPLILRGFHEGCRRLEQTLTQSGIAFSRLAQIDRFTGCEALYTAQAEPLSLKRLCSEIENADALSRLFDLDVIAADGGQVSRTQLGLAERGCMVCGAPGRGCASRRTHSAEELQRETQRRLTDFFSTEDRRFVEKLAKESLIAEVNVTPKPGLVDKINSGSHRDMDLALFERSAAAIAPYFGMCFAVGSETAALAPEETFSRLRAVGLAAEAEMLRATGGVNTHKGAIFLLGTLCAAVGRLHSADAPCRDAGRLCAECAKMTGAQLERELSAIRAETATTAGEKLYLQHGLRGARGELSDGLPGAVEIALPALRAGLAQGLDENHAAAVALLHLIARGTDTNMHRRGGAEGAAWGAAQAKALLASERIPSPDEIAALDHRFIEKNLSPGGCADLLAAALFLHKWENNQK